jgi:hypothetical protein
MLDGVRWSFRGNGAWRPSLAPRRRSFRSELAFLGIFGLLGCGLSTRHDLDDREPMPSNAGKPGNENSKVAVACRQTALSLGPVANVPRQGPEVVWMGDDFAVFWASPDGYHVTITDGRSISSQLDLSLMPSAEPSSPAQLFWTGSELRLYYAVEDALFFDVFIRGGPLWALTETRAVGTGLPFRAVQMTPERIAVLTSQAIYLDDTEIPRSPQYTPPGRVGWDGESFLISSVLGHGSWTLNGLASDGGFHAPAIDRTWCGICAAGEAGGSSFASSEATGRHALAIATREEIVLSIEGAAPIERTPVGSPQAFVLWDGQRYALLLADLETPSDAGLRDLWLFAVSGDGVVLTETGEASPISRDSRDDRFPAAAAAAPGDYGIAWLRGEEQMFQRCVLDER